MSNKVIVLWGSVIVLLVLAIYTFGVMRKDNLKQLEAEKLVKESLNNYMDDNEIELPYKTTTEELIKNGYLEEIIVDNRVCNATVTVKKKLLGKDYDIKFTCINEEIK